MKILVLLILSLSGVHAFACVNSHNFTYCVGDSVISSKEMPGVITQIFKFGKVAVKFDGDLKHYPWPTKLLAVVKGCSSLSSLHCVNTKVINSKGTEGLIVGIFQSGQVVVKYPRDSKYYTSPVDQLTIASVAAFARGP